MNAVSTQRLTRRFGTLVAVNELTIDVHAGSVFGLLGPNGAGKTSVIKMLTTLLPPTSGTAQVAGFDVVAQPFEVRRRIGYVPQMPSADPDLTGWENLLIFAKLYEIPRSLRGERIKGALHLMGLDGAAGMLVAKYSGGMVRRLEIAQSALHHPDILFLDEPTIGLDPAARRGVWDHMRQMKAEFATTIVMTTHYMDEAQELCDHIAFMHRGALAKTGTPAELEAAYGADATLDDVFVQLAGSDIEGGSFRDAARSRRAARR